jgi:hypothetical protein
MYNYYERNLDGDISVEPIPGPYTKDWQGKIG